MRALMLAGVAASGVWLGSAQAYPAYTITDLGTSGVNSAAAGLNRSGQAVGYADNSNRQPQAFRYSNGAVSNIGTLGGDHSYAAGINDNGVVVGTAATSAGKEVAYVYSGGTLTSLGTLGGASSSGYGINNSGQVTGSSATAKPCPIPWPPLTAPDRNTSPCPRLRKRAKLVSALDGLRRFGRRHPPFSAG